MSSLLKLGTNTAPTLLKQGGWFCAAQHFCRNLSQLQMVTSFWLPFRGWHRMGDTATPDVEMCRGEKGYCNPPAPQPITALYVRKVVLNLVFVGQGQAPQSYCPVSRLILAVSVRKGLHWRHSAQEPGRAVLLQRALNTAPWHWGWARHSLWVRLEKEFLR